MTKDTKPDAPVVEQLLDTAHSNLPALRERREAMLRSGISQNDLPDDVALMAFVLLGDHERETIAAQLCGCWPNLQEKGFAYGGMGKAPTAELRLLAHVRDYTDAVGSTMQQLRDAKDVASVPDELLRCASEVRGLWGQTAQVHFSIPGNTRNMLIDPDPVFGLRPALVATDPNRGSTGYFALPVDRGLVRITLLTRSGQLFRHIVQVRVEGAV